MPSAPGQRKRRPLPWNEAQLKALALIFEGRKTHEQIAAACSDTPLRTLRDWLAHPDFEAKLQELRADLLAGLMAQGARYVTKQQRIIGLSQMGESAREQYETRPLLVEERPMGRDPDSGEPLVMTNEHFNADAFSAFRGALDDIAKELGHRKAEKAEGDAAQVRIIIETDSADAPAVRLETDAGSTGSPS